MVEAVKEFFTKYATFSGRTSRKNFWLAILGIWLISLVLGFVCGFIGGLLGDSAATVLGFIPTIFALAIIIPSIAIEVRRLHDINKSGWFIFISLIPFVGSIILLVFMCLPAVNEGNNY